MVAHLEIYLFRNISFLEKYIIFRDGGASRNISFLNVALPATFRCSTDESLRSGKATIKTKV